MKGGLLSRLEALLPKIALPVRVFECRAYQGKPRLEALERGARNAVMVSVACAAAGIIVGIVGLTGQGLNFSSLVLLDLGVPLLAAHMIVFWYSQDANVTPPVSLASFAGAGVAGAHPMRTAITSWKLAKGLYIIPIVMAYRPLLGGAPWWEVVLTMLTCAAGLLAFAAALDRYLLRRATWLETVMLLLASVCLFWPDVTLPSGSVIPAYLSDALGAALLGAAVVSQSVKGPRRDSRPSIDPSLRSG